MALAAAPAGAQTSPAPPAPGVTLGVATSGVNAPVTSAPDLFYTGTDGHVYMRDLSVAGSSPVSLGGTLRGGPAAVWIPYGDLVPWNTLAVFGRGADNRLWCKTFDTNSGWSPWRRLGGVLTSKPAVVLVRDHHVLELQVFARGTDGAVWGFSGLGSAPTPFKVGGQLLPGTAPAVASADGYAYYVVAVGTDHAVWAAEMFAGQNGSSWWKIGGRTTSNPGIAAVNGGSLVAFARGTDNAAWYNEFIGYSDGVSPGWHSFGGKLTSGVAALTTEQNQQFGPTYVFALDAGSQPIMASGIWPAIGGWTQP